MSDFKQNAALKIQCVFKINHCVNTLDKFKKLELKNKAESVGFDDFKKIIIKKDIIETTKEFTESLDKYKKGLGINPRVLITAFMILYYPTELLGEEIDMHPSDNFIHELSNQVVASLEEGKINKIWAILRDFKIGFNNWSKMDKDRTIERLVISYYYRCDHIKKIKSGELVKKVDLFDPDQQFHMIKELERQKEDIIKSIKLIDRNFDVIYLKENYEQIYNTIQQSWANVQVNVANTMKKAFYDMLVKDINDGNLLSCFNLLKEIGERLCAICPPKRVNAFRSKFSEDNLTTLLAVPEFSPQLIKFIGMILDFIILMDAPVNDETNKQWKEQVVDLLGGDFSTNFPKILIQMEEHIDVIFELIMDLNNSNNNKD